MSQPHWLCFLQFSPFFEHFLNFLHSMLFQACRNAGFSPYFHNIFGGTMQCIMDCFSFCLYREKTKLELPSWLVEWIPNVSIISCHKLKFRLRLCTCHKFKLLFLIKLLQYTHIWLNIKVYTVNTRLCKNMQGPEM